MRVDTLNRYGEKQKMITYFFISVVELQENLTTRLIDRIYSEWKTQQKTAEDIVGQ